MALRYMTAFLFVAAKLSHAIRIPTEDRRQNSESTNGGSTQGRHKESTGEKNIISIHCYFIINYYRVIISNVLEATREAHRNDFLYPAEGRILVVESATIDRG